MDQPINAAGAKGGVAPGAEVKPAQGSTSDNQREQNQALFRQFLRQADKCVMERQFGEARQNLEEAKKLSPRNPFILAFEERIALFESKSTLQAPQPPAGEPEVAAKPEGESPADAVAPAKSAREELEASIRQEVEAEYRIRFTSELRKAEEHAAAILNDERTRLEQQRQGIREKYDQQLGEAKHNLEEEYRKKLGEEIAKAEQRLEQQHKSELSFIENEIRTQLTRQFENEQAHLQDSLRKEREKLLGEEQTAVRDRESQMKEQFNQKLLEALRKAETVFREQSDTQQKAEEERLRKQFNEEFTRKIAAERDAMREQYASMKSALEESFRQEQKKLETDNDAQLRQRLEDLRRQEAGELEEKRSQLRVEVENDLRSEYERRLSQEREHLQTEVEQVLEAERNRLHSEFDSISKSQSDNLQKVRTDLRAEMERHFLARLEQIASEYDHKMELLGVKIPRDEAERTALYRSRMYNCYADGEPSVEHARNLMELKEMLELTFDEHLAIESDVRMELYVKGVERRILAHELDVTNAEALDQLKQQFHITSEEALRLEPYILSSFQRLVTKGRVLVVDDEPLMLTGVRDILMDAGYQVLTADNITTALQQLQTTSVDLILSDIKFPDAELDGFKFFRCVQEQPHLRTIPFIFMSALQEGVIVRSGVQLGVDDYLVKPMDPDLLVAVIEGKLRRYRSMTQG